MPRVGEAMGQQHFLPALGEYAVGLLSLSQWQCSYIQNFKHTYLLAQQHHL